MRNLQLLDSSQMSLGQWNDIVEAFASEGADHSLTNRVGFWLCRGVLIGLMPRIEMVLSKAVEKMQSRS